MLYLLDADVLIHAANGYFQLDRVPQFWDWLIAEGQAGRVALPREIWEEFKAGRDDLGTWARSDAVKTNLLFGEEPQQATVGRVVREGYGADLTDAEIEALGRDPFLIGYALGDPSSRTVVTDEHSKPSRTRGGRHIPDVCRDLQVPCMNGVGLINALDFRIR